MKNSKKNAERMPKAFCHATFYNDGTVSLTFGTYNAEKLLAGKSLHTASEVTWKEKVKDHWEALKYFKKALDRHNPWNDEFFKMTAEKATCVIKLADREWTVPVQPTFDEYKALFRTVYNETYLSHGSRASCASEVKEAFAGIEGVNHPQLYFYTVQLEKEFGDLWNYVGD